MLAKLTRPRLHAAIKRTRLFKLLDQRKQHPIVWVSGPPGAGKTTLVVSYTERVGIPVYWYQVDQGDRDLASFFYYLSELAKQSGPRTRSTLPLLTAEYQNDLTGFARRFSREFFARLSRPSMLVFDNYQEGEMDLNVVMAELVREIPDSINAVVLSRTNPAQEFARLLAHQSIVRIEWEHLRFSVKEIKSLATTSPGIDDSMARRLLEQSEGWAAGLRLILDGMQHGNRVAASPDRTQEHLFNYFACEIFGKAPADIRHFWLSTAFLPRVTVKLARDISGNASAAALLEDLYRRHLFTDQRGDTRIEYEYHTLFLEFLRARARIELDPVQIQTLQKRAAELLEADGQTEEAIGCYLEARDWTLAARLIVAQAPHALAHGRGATVRGWIKTIPAWHVETTPRLLHTLGAAQVSIAPAKARQTLERAYSRLAVQRNDIGQAMVIASIIESYYFEYDSFVGLEKWIAALAQLLGKGLAFPSQEVELRVYSCMQFAMAYREPCHPFLPSCAENVMGLLSRKLEVNQTVIAAALLLTYFDWFNAEKANQVVSVVRPLLASPNLAPFNHIWWLLAEAHHFSHVPDHKQLQSAFEQARTIARNHDLRMTSQFELIIELWQKVAGDDIKAASALVSQVEQQLGPGRRQEALVFYEMAAIVALAQNDAVHALDYAKRGITTAEETGTTSELLAVPTIAALALTEMGQTKEARVYLQMTRQNTPAHAETLLFHQSLVEASILLREGKTASAEALLRAALAVGRRHGYLTTYRWIPHIVARLCAQALAADIEVAYVTRLIRARGLKSPSPAFDRWPWSIKVLTLGPFALYKDSGPLVVSAKAQMKPLELLKALIARGGLGVDASALANDLWPDSDGDAAANVFAMTLHRLRKLLGNDAVLNLHEGKLSLDLALCWVDALALQRLLEQADSTKFWTQAAENALALYRGHFLEHDAPAQWSIAARVRLWRKFLRSLSRLGQHYEQAMLHDKAIAIYRRGLEIDPLTEELYQQLMACHLSLQQRAEVANVYRRCRETLSVALGVAPSAKIEALRRAAEGHTA